MKIQNGYVKPECGSWLGHYSKYSTDPLTGEKKRRQLAYKIGPVDSMTKTEAKEKLRERMGEEFGLAADNRVSRKWGITTKWRPAREATWRAATRQTNLER